jgi:excinuclease ABC subunit C
MSILTAQGRPRTADAQLDIMRATVRGGTTDRPGIYRMVAEDGEVLYVGKSKQLRTRLLSYFRCAYPGDKGGRILRAAHSIEWEYTPSEFGALLRELRLIKQHRPRYNVAMKRDGRHYAFIKVTRGTAPKLLVVRAGGSDDNSVYYGPFHGAQRISEAVRELNDALGLRDCSLDRTMAFSDQQEIFSLMPRTPGCIRYEINRCLGPCIGACSEHEYMDRVRLARAFLEGANDGPMEQLRREMDASSERLEYERAAALRDKLQRLEMLREQFGKLRFAVETLSFVYTVPGHDGDDRVYMIRRGQVRAEQPAPRTTRDRSRIRELADDIFRPVERVTGAVPPHEIDELLLLSSWFRRFPKELDRTQPATNLARHRSA